MEFQGGMSHVKSYFGPFRDSVSDGANRCTVCAKCTIAQKSFWIHPVVVLCDEAQVEARFGLFGDSANLDVR
jgi:hypothetical protein